MREASFGSKVDTASDGTVFQPMDPNVEQWTQREIQLNQMHEEILAQREALLLRRGKTNSSNQDEESKTNSEAFVRVKERNETLLQDIATAQSKLLEDGHRPVSPRFSTLQSNYWVMVKNVSPVWEEELLEYKQKQRGKQTPQGQRSPGLRRLDPHQHGSPHSRRKLPGMQLRSPKFQRRSPKVQRRPQEMLATR